MTACDAFWITQETTLGRTDTGKPACRHILVSFHPYFLTRSYQPGVLLTALLTDPLSSREAGIASAMLFGALRLIPLFPTPNLHRRPRFTVLPKQKGESKRLSSCITSGRYLLSHAVAHILPSARDGLTAGFGMEPGVSRPGIFTQNICSLKST